VLARVEINDLKHKLDYSSCYTILSPLYVVCSSFKGKIFHTTKENIKLKQEIAYLTSRLERMVVSEKMIEDDLSRIEDSATMSTYKLDVDFERCDNKSVKSAPNFIPSSNYHQELKIIKSTKTHYPSSPKSPFNPKTEVRKEIPKPREEAFVCMFYSYAGHLDEFYFCCMRIEMRHFEYIRNSYRDVFLHFPPRSYSRALSHTSSRTLSHFSHGPNHYSYGFGSRENNFVPRRFGYGPRPHRGDYFLHRSGFPAEGSHTHFEPRHLDGSCFLRRGSRPTWTNGEMQRTMKTSSGHMVKC
jgi:hypothetical protein